jgi:DNA-binding transcriptional LysR family regulator
MAVQRWKETKVDSWAPLPWLALAIGSLETTAALHLTPLLSRYAEENSEVDLTLHTGTTRELTTAVAE